jgi:hypothetical protein
MAEFDPSMIFGKRGRDPKRDALMAAILEMLADMLRDEEEENQAEPERQEPVPVILPWAPSGGP